MTVEMTLTAKEARYYEALWRMPDHSGLISDVVKAGYVARGESKSMGQTFRRMPEWVKGEEGDVSPKYGTIRKKWTCIGGPLPEGHWQNLNLLEGGVEGAPSGYVRKHAKEYPVFDIVSGDKGPCPLHESEGYENQWEWERTYYEPHDASATFPDLKNTHVEIPVADNWIGQGFQPGPEFGGYICLPNNAYVVLYVEDKQSE